MLRGQDGLKPDKFKAKVAIYRKWLLTLGQKKMSEHMSNVSSGKRRKTMLPDPVPCVVHFTFMHVGCVNKWVKS